MREIIFDTETTGLDNKLDRVIEIGGIELEQSFSNWPQLSRLYQSGRPQGSSGRAGHPWHFRRGR